MLELRSLATGALTRVVSLPGVGSVAGFSGRRTDSEFFLKFVSFVDPGSTFRGDLTAPPDAPLALIRRPTVDGFDPDAFETSQEFVTSKDGTRVPMFLLHRKGLPRDGSSPALLYGYGGFNISLTPSFSISRVMFAAAYDGVVAVANIRGGGEYGTEWRDAGSVLNKQNVFDDFQACAEHLVEKGYAKKGAIAIEGGSNGGLLVAACCNQR